MGYKNKAQLTADLINGHKYDAFMATVGLSAEITTQAIKDMARIINKPLNPFSQLGNQGNQLGRIATRVVDEYEDLTNNLAYNNNINDQDKGEIANYALSIAIKTVDAMGFDVAEMFH